MGKARVFRSALALLVVFAVGISSYQAGAVPPAAASETDNLTLPTSVAGSSSTFVTIGSDAVVVTGYSQTVRIVISSNNPDARFKLTTDVSLTKVAGYANQSTITAEGNPIAFEATGPNAQTALRGLQYKSTPGASDTISIDVSPQGLASWQNPATGWFHYYRAVSDTSRTWEAARAHAQLPVSLGGSNRNGWLVTIGSAAENLHVTKFVSVDAWMGAHDTETEGKWVWVSEAGDDLAGKQFWQGNQTGSAFESRYSNWRVTGGTRGEPNNSGSNEHAAQFYATSKDSDGGAYWNDLPHTGTTLGAYIWEYAQAARIGGLALTRTMSALTPATAPANSALPSISGTAETGSILTAAEGTWTTGGSAVTATSYQWKRIKGGVTTDIAGATAATLCVPNTSDVIGSTLVVTVTKTNVMGSTSVTSSETAVVTEGISCPAPPPAAAPSVVTPVPTPTSTPPAPIRPSAPPLLPQQPQSGPVLRNNQVPTPPTTPQSLINGVPTQVSTQVADPNNVNIRAGLLNLGLNVQNGQGGVRQGTGGSTELDVVRGGQAGLQGSGLQPGSFVQVFMPLQGTNSREIGRIPVDQNGSFSGDLVFGNAPTESQLPIGRNVLQMVSVDEQGRQAVVEMAINVAQPPPTPQILRQNQTLPSLPVGDSIATRDGLPVPVTVSALPDQGAALIEGDGWNMSVQVGGDNSVAETDSGASLTFTRNQSASISGSGLMPGTRADIWLFSEPTLLGSVTVAEDGTFSGLVNVDANVITVGEHTLQMQGVGPDGYILAANLGVLVSDEDAAVGSTSEEAGGLLWWLAALVALLAIGALLLWWRRSRARL